MFDELHDIRCYLEGKGFAVNTISIENKKDFSTCTLNLLKNNRKMEITILMLSNDKAYELIKNML